jgi:APA family basic amino acid/polyamine antiporter
VWSDLSITVGDHHVTLLTFGPTQAIAIALIAGITALHAFDTKIGGRVQAVFTAVKVLLIAVFVVGGLLFGHGHWSNFSSQGGGLSNMGTSAFAVALMFASFSYSGWNAAGYIAGEIDKPARTLPRALMLGTGIVMTLYVLLNVVFLYAVPTSVLAGSPDKPVVEVGALAATSLFGDEAGRLLTSVIALALVSAVSAMVMAGPRVYAAMAANRALPARLAAHSARGVPTVAVIAQGVLATVFVLVGDLGSLIRFVGFTLAIFAALTVGSLFVLRARGMRSTYQAPLYPLTPIAFIAMSAWIAVNQICDNPFESLIGGVVLGIGALLYFVFVATGRPPRAVTVPEARVVHDHDHSSTPL